MTPKNGCDFIRCEMAVIMKENAVFLKRCTLNYVVKIQNACYLL